MSAGWLNLICVAQYHMWLW